MSPEKLLSQIVLLRSYLRKHPFGRENYQDMAARVCRGFYELAGLAISPSELDNVMEMMLSRKAFPSGRALWILGTLWFNMHPDNYHGAFNCTSRVIRTFEDMSIMMDLAMMGTGTGAVLGYDEIPNINTVINLIEITETGTQWDSKSPTQTVLHTVIADDEGDSYTLTVGDSRKGWVDAYLAVLNLSIANPKRSKSCNLVIDLGYVRPEGTPIQGFGGMANPIGLAKMFTRIIAILNDAIGRQLTTVEKTLLIDEAAATVVAGNIRRSAGMRQAVSTDQLFATAKDNLWKQNALGEWAIDPARDALRMANHTRVFHKKPTYDEVLASVQKQYQSGEGAIQFAPEAIARCNADLLYTPKKKSEFIDLYCTDPKMGKAYLRGLMGSVNANEPELDHRIMRFGLNPCGEIIGADFSCNLGEIHLNMLDFLDIESQTKAFQAAAIAVTALLAKNFTDPVFNQSQRWDPIVGVSVTGAFDFFVNVFGLPWLKWWQAGRPGFWEADDDGEYNKKLETYLENAWGMQLPHVSTATYFRQIEREFLWFWKNTVLVTVSNICERNGWRKPTRYTTVQPSGCLTVDALRVFDQGLMYADEHMDPQSGDVDLTEFNLSVQNGLSIQYGIANAPLPVMEITLNNKRVIKATKNHRFMLTSGDWVEAQDLKSGDELVISLGEYRNAQEAKLNWVDLPERKSPTGRFPKGCTQPEEMSPDLAYFLGAFYANGSFSQRSYRIRFSHGRLDVLMKLRDIGQRLFGLSGVLNVYERDNKYELCFANKQLFAWFEANGFDKLKSVDIKRIPFLVRCSSRDSILSFFAGLIDCDGCIRENGALSIDFANEDWVRHLQQIGEAVGLSFSISHNTEGENLQTVKDMWSVSLSKMMSLSESLSYLNDHSIKAQTRPIAKSLRQFKHEPYKIASVHEAYDPELTYDYSVDADDDDSWYWQGCIKSHNSKSLITGASPGWHPPKAQRFIRRVTFARQDPIAQAARRYGCNVVPSQSCKDAYGLMLTDPDHPEVFEWLVEIPIAVSWADLPGADEIDVHQFSAAAQFDFWMQFQKHYTTHNTSATIELREHEIDDVASLIYAAIQRDEGYISTALLQRLDLDTSCYPNLPFEPITRDRYLELVREMATRRESDDFDALLRDEDAKGQTVPQESPVECGGGSCTI